MSPLLLFRNTPPRAAAKVFTARGKLTHSTSRQQPIMKTPTSEKDVVQGFPKTALRLFGHSLAYEDDQDAMDQAVTLYWQHHGSAALSHQLAVWLLCVARRERATSMMVGVDDCGVVTVDTESETSRTGAKQGR